MSRASLTSSSCSYSSSCCCILARISAISRSLSAKARRLASRSWARAASNSLMRSCQPRACGGHHTRGGDTLATVAPIHTHTDWQKAPCNQEHRAPFPHKYTTRNLNEHLVQHLLWYGPSNT
uniref:Uncharacterized protein n=1 Tax=Scleropages formosus TaxID=113540 RepID=A0A8C9R8E2_SCLFO